MEFYQVINNRRTVRDLKENAISDEALERIIVAGLQAPTHNHQREWEFIGQVKRDVKDTLHFCKW